MRCVIAWLVGAALFVGCSSAGLQGELVRIEPGPSFGRDVRSIATLSATCGAMESMEYLGHATSECDEGMIATIDRVTLGFLDSAGVRIVRTRVLNAATFEKLKALRRLEPIDEGLSEVHSDEVEEGGPRVLFRSASPVLQKQVLEELGVDAVLRTRILVGAGVGMSNRRRIVALVTLFDREGGLVWASRCEREAGPFMTSSDVMEVTMCALEEAASL